MSEHRIFLRGEIDLDCTPPVRAEFLAGVARDGAHLVVDCAQLTFVDSTGIAILLEANRELEVDGSSSTCRPRGVVVFEILGLGDLLRYEGSPPPEGSAKPLRRMALPARALDGVNLRGGSRRTNPARTPAGRDTRPAALLCSSVRAI